MKKSLLLGFLTLGMMAAGCSNDLNTPEVNLEEKGSIKVSIRSGNSSTRAEGEPTQQEENKVTDFTVYVFNYSTGALELKETVTGTLEKTIGGLSVVSSKKVVVLVNEPSGVFSGIANYNQLNNAYLNLDSQVEALAGSNFKGLFMSGETQDPVVLTTDADPVDVPVTVRRLTAKIKLGKILVQADNGVDISKFTLGGISIQEAREKAIPMGNGMVTDVSNVSYVQGIESYKEEDNSWIVSKEYLNQFYSLPADYVEGTELSPKYYFYVFPNNNDDDKSTLLTVYGLYDGKPMYFPFRINDKNMGIEGSADGTWIQRNKVYTLNVSLKKLASGGEEPNTPNDEVSMDLQVKVADWEGSLVQDVEW